MTRTETTALLKRIAVAYGRKLDTETIDEWQRHLQPTPANTANAALDRIIQTGEPGPTVARIIQETGATRQLRHYDLPPTIGQPGCFGCDSTGFTPVDEDGITRWHPCPCRGQ